jgi:hypothetical protein
VGVVVGGLASIPGAIFGAIFIQFVPNIADEISKSAPWAIYGVFLIAFMYLLPTGVMGGLRTAVGMRCAEAPPDVILSAHPRVAELSLQPSHRRHCDHESQALHPRRGRPSRWLIGTGTAWAQKKYDPGADDKEIKIGAIHPYSGPASAYGAIGKAIGAYFAKVNDEGGINGRKINYISLDDGYNPAKTVEQARKLVEEEEVLLRLQPAGHAAQQRHPQVHEPEEGAAALRGHRRHQVGRPEELPLDHGLAAQLPEPRPRSSPRTSWRPSRTPRSPCCTRTTTTARTT